MTTTANATTPANATTNTTVASPRETDTASGARLTGLLRTGGVAAVLAAVATESFTAVVRFAGVDLAVGDPGGHASSVVPVTAGACAISIAFCMVLGTALVAGIKRWATNPARVWWAVASVLVLASLIAPLTAAGTSAPTKATLVVAHLIAAAVIVPMLGRRLAAGR